jgi:hypothetical protein
MKNTAFTDPAQVMRRSAPVLLMSPIWFIRKRGRGTSIRTG